MQRDINGRGVSCLQKTETMTEKERATEFLRQHHISGADFTYTTGFDNMVRLLEAYAAQQSKIHKPDVNLEYWQKWLTEHGYQIEFDDDGLWAEDWVQDHKWVDIFDLMMQFAIEQQSKMPTEQPEQLTCDACGCHPSIIVQTPVGRFCMEHAKYF